MNEKKSFLGVGWQFPIEVDKVTGKIKESSYEDSIAESVKIILRTQRGERIMRPEFGCDLRSFAFAEINYTTMSEIELEVKNSLILCEPRIIDIDVKCHEGGDALLYIDISYVVRSTNNPFNIVYPFYLSEGN